MPRSRKDPPAHLSDLTAPSGALTRRRALTLGAAVGLGSLLRLPPALAWAAERSAEGASSFGLDVPGSAFRGGRITGVLRAPRRFDLLGVRGAGVAGSALEVRVRRRSGQWSRWVPLGHAHATDVHAGHAMAARLAPTDPVWVGGADELQLRSRRPLGGLRVHFVAVVPTRGRARAAQSPAPAPTEPAPTDPAATDPTATAEPQAAATPEPGTAPPIIRRAAWGGDGVPPRVPPSYGQVKVAFVHHTVSANEYGREDSAGIVLAICKYHRDTNGWNDIGYNFLVDKYGQVFEGRAGGVEAAVVGAHAQGYNDISTGVATIGTFTETAPGDAALEAVAHLLGWKLSLHGVPVEGDIVVRSGGGSLNRYPAGTQVRLNRICGHRDGDSTTCPGEALYGRLADLRRRAAQYAGPVAPAPVVTLAAGTQPVRYGETVRVSGVVRGANGLPAAGVPVSVQKRGPTAWVTVARATTLADGSWTAQLPWRRAGSIRARAVVGDSPAVTTSPVVSLGLIPTLQARLFTSRVRAGSAPLLTGIVRPTATVYVRVERQTRTGGWAVVADVPVRASGHVFQTRIRLRRPALYRLIPRTAGPDGPVTAPGLYVRAVRRRRARRATVPGSPPS